MSNNKNARYFFKKIKKMEKNFMNVKSRLLNYISYHTTSDDSTGTSPSTKRQFDLAKELERELLELKLTKVTLSNDCYVYGFLPATNGYENFKSMAFIAHMDTAPDMSGKDINPQIIENYNGCDIHLVGTNDSILIKDFPHLKQMKGNTIITTDGTTLLGADDKAGIAEIMTALEEIIAKEIPHGDIWVAFTPDEEIGCGSDHFDLDYVKADFAYTVDGGYEGEIAYENFNAGAASFIITGRNVHPGEAKNIMINAASVACEIQSMLPSEQTPEHTEDREGFIHLTDISGDIGCAKLSYIIRDHDIEKYQYKLRYLENITEFMNLKYGKNIVNLHLEESYRNMLEIIEQHMDIIQLAQDAIISTGLSPISTPVRGGTDGARLSFMGLPCPNLGTGGYGFHGPYEHIAVESMETVVNILCYIASHPIEK